MRRFRKKPGIAGALSLPGLPGVTDDVIVEGEGYARFCPAVLEEVFDSLDELIAEPLVQQNLLIRVLERDLVVEQPIVPVLTEEALEPQVVLEPPVSDQHDFEPPLKEERPTMLWSKGRLVAYARKLGLDSTGLTKAQILEEVAAEEGR